MCHLGAMACAIASRTTWKCRASHNDITDIKCTRLAAITQGTVYLNDVNDKQHVLGLVRAGERKEVRMQESKKAREQERAKAKARKHESKLDYADFVCWGLKLRLVYTTQSLSRPRAKHS